MSDHGRESAWVGFWNRSGLRRAVLFAAVYLALYLGAGLFGGQLFGDQVDTEDVFDTPQSVFVALTLPLIVGSILLAAFAYSVGWFRPLFARQPVGGRWWMWIAPVAIVAATLLRFLGIPYGDYGASVVLVTLATGLLVGFAEEILTRGIVVKMMRDAGHGEWIVMVVSSLIFALLHSANILSGMAVATVAFTVVYTFGFGICMYLTLRATGNLIWPMFIHGMYDAMLFLASGGVDKVSNDGTPNIFLALAAPANIVIMALGIVGLIFVRGRAQRTPTPDQMPASVV